MHLRRKTSDPKREVSNEEWVRYLNELVFSKDKARPHLERLAKVTRAAVTVRIQVLSDASCVGSETAAFEQFRGNVTAGVAVGDAGAAAAASIAPLPLPLRIKVECFR